MGSSKGSQTIGYRYYMSILMGIARGPIDEIVQIDAGNVRAWPVPDGDSEEISGLMTVAQGPNGMGVAQYEDGTYVTVAADQINTISTSGDYQVNAPNLFGGDKKEGGIVGALRVMMGSATQIVPAYIKTLMGGRVPDFRGVATMYFDGLLCSLNPYPKKWELRVRRVTQGWDGDVWQPSLATVWMRGGTIKAMNGAHILYESLTNRDWGRGMPRSNIEDTVWLRSAEILHSEGMGLCLRYNRQSELSDFIQNVLDHIGGTLYPDRSTGRLALSLMRGDYDLDDIPLFTYDTGLLSLDDVETSGQEDLINEVIIKWTDPIGKSERSARVQNLASRQTMGATNSTTTTLAGVPDVDLALRLCQRDLKAGANALKRFRVTLDRRAWRLVPGAVFRISVPERNIYNAVLRAGKVTEAGGTDGRISAEAVLDVFGLPAASFVAAQETEWVPPNREALIANRRLVREATYAELAVALDPANLAILSSTTGTVAALVGKPSSLSQGYDVSVLPDGATEPTLGRGAFVPYVVASASIPATATPVEVTFTESVDIGLLEIGMAVQMGDEIGRLDDIEMIGDGGTVTIARGCVDTLPQAHSAGTTLYFVTSEVGGDGREYASGDTLDVQILTFTSTSRLSAAIAPTDTIEVVGRQGRPYAPGNVLVDGATYLGVPLVVNSMTLTWAHRDRLIQQDQLIAHNEASVGPEADVSYTVRIYPASTGAPVRTVTGIMGTEFIYTSEMVIADTIGDGFWVELEAVRDGLTSFSTYRFAVEFEGSGYGLSGYGDAYGM